jgi:hypothetical protein
LLGNIPSPATPPSRLELAAATVSALSGRIKREGWSIDRPFSTGPAADLPNPMRVMLPSLHAAAAGADYFSLLSI